MRDIRDVADLPPAHIRGFGSLPGRLREPGGFALTRPRHGGVDPRSAPPLGGSRSTQPDGEDPRHGRGLPAITTLLSEGVNINVTLLFGLRRYREVLAAHACGLLKAAAEGLDVGGIGSVASFFVSRVDTLVDCLLDFKAEIAGDPLEQVRLMELRGRAAIANARAARVAWEQWLAADQMVTVLAAGGRPQRLLWASTSAKNPVYRDVLYLEELVGFNTVTTIPLETIAAFADHGRVRGATLTYESAVADSAATLEALAGARIKMESIAIELETAGVKLFADSYAELLEGVEAKTRALLAA